MADKNCVTLYITSISSCAKTKACQQKIRMILESKKIPFEEVDISSSTELRDKMRELAGDEHAAPPQIAKGTSYLGDFTAFENAVEDGDLQSFLKL